MAHLTIRNPFKNQGLAIFGALTASFGKRFGKKKPFKINDLPQMAQIVRLKGRGGEFGKQEKKKRVKENVTEM